MQRQELLTLITAQLRHFGLEQAAASVLECSGLDLHAPASDKLAELCAAGLAAQDGDEEGETIEAAAEMDDEELAELLSANGLDLDVKKAGHLATPDFSCWYSSQHRGPGLATAFSKDGRYAATGSADATIKVIDVYRIHAAFLDKSDQKPVIRTLYDHTGPVNALKFHPNGKLLASASDDCDIKLFDLTRPGVKRGFRVLHDIFPVKSLSFHPSGDFLATGTTDASLRLFDIHTLQCFQPLDAAPPSNDVYLRSLSSVEYSPDGNLIATASQDGVVKLFDANAGQCIRTIEKAHSGASVHAVSFSRNGRYLLTSGSDSVGRLWDVSSGKCLVSYEGATNTKFPVNMVFSRSEDYVLAADELTNGLVTFNARTGELIKKFPVHAGPVHHLSSSANDNGVFTAGEDCRVKYWNMSAV